MVLSLEGLQCYLNDVWLSEKQRVKELVNM